MAGFLSGFFSESAVMSFFIFVAALFIPFLVFNAFLNLTRSNQFRWEENIVQEGKQNGLRYALGMALMSLYIGLWTLLFIIPGFLKQFEYMMTPFVMKDNPNMGANAAITESRRLVKGNLTKLFGLYFSYHLPILILSFVGAGSASLSIGGFLFSAFGGGGAGLAVITGLISILAIIGTFVWSVRMLPRWNMALALFYEELNK